MLKSFIKLNKDICKRLSMAYPNIFGGDVSTHKFRTLLYKHLEKYQKPTVLECGGANRPFLPLNDAYELHGIDIDDSRSCVKNYDQYFCTSVENRINDHQYELIYSITLLEHVKNNTLSIENMSLVLKDNGVQLHYIPNKYHLYAIILQILGHNLQRKLIGSLRPEAKEVSGYKAYFNLCSPQKMKKEFEKSCGQRVKIYCFYRANEYFSFFVPFYVTVTLFENFCRHFNINIFCSGFIVEVEK